MGSATEFSKWSRRTPHGPRGMRVIHHGHTGAKGFYLKSLRGAGPPMLAEYNTRCSDTILPWSLGTAVINVMKGIFIL